MTAPGICGPVVWDEGPELLNPSRAAFDPARVYRYQLTRTWNPDWPPITWIMLNPSKADAFTEDNTSRRCGSFSRAWHAGGLRILNLFAYSATDPTELRRAADPVGPLNDRFILEACTRDTVVVAAWGAHGTLNGRAADVTRMLTAANARVHCLGTTRDGHPRHPLYVPASTQLEIHQERPS